MLNLYLMFCSCFGSIIILIYFLLSSFGEFSNGLVSFTSTTAVVSAIEQILIIYCAWISVICNYLPLGIGAPLFTHTHFPDLSETLED